MSTNNWYIFNFLDQAYYHIDHSLNLLGYNKAGGESYALKRSTMVHTYHSYCSLSSFVAVKIYVYLLPGCLSVSSNDGGKGLPRLGEDGSFDWACTQLLGPRVHSRAAEGPLHLMKTSSEGIRTNPNSFLHSLLAKGCLDLL